MRHTQWFVRIACNSLAKFVMANATCFKQSFQLHPVLLVQQAADSMQTTVSGPADALVLLQPSFGMLFK
jgi:hypothetical protein